MKKIKGFKGYFIDKNGVIYSMVKKYRQAIPVKPRIIKQWKSAGHFGVHLSKNRKMYKRWVHRLVLETFIGKCPKGKECRHLNGNGFDNRLENLKWGTRKENQNDRIVHGVSNRGERHGLNKYSEKDIIKIRRMLKEGMKNIEVARKLKIPQSTISWIKNYGWKHIKP
jgi:hypothetical protein